RAFLLHCVRPAAEGGVNTLLDPEILYLRLRDENPEWVAALMHPRAMCIPAHVEDGVELRPQQYGPVFEVDAAGSLHLRYTARTRSIAWRDDPATRAALARLEEMLASPLPEVFSHRLESGQGLLCNNVLHGRSAFRDGPGPGRLLYRARFLQRVQGT
ncbi:MAG TPA: TauD/TfdA family dioxygenase, partial [Gammaproteobacteria bacterium]